MATQVIVTAQPARVTQTVKNRIVVYPIDAVLTEDEVSSLNELHGFDLVCGAYNRHGYEWLIKAKIAGEPQYYLVNFGYRG